MVPSLLYRACDRLLPVTTLETRATFVRGRGHLLGVEGRFTSANATAAGVTIGFGVVLQMSLERYDRLGRMCTIA